MRIFAYFFSLLIFRKITQYMFFIDLVVLVFAKCFPVLLDVVFTANPQMMNMKKYQIKKV